MPSTPFLTRSSRFGRGRVRFIAVPPDYDVNATNTWIVNSALAAGLYPKILTISMLKDGKSDMRTINNNQSATFHPSSINFGRKARDFGVHHLCYFTLMCVTSRFVVFSSTDAQFEGIRRNCMLGKLDRSRM